MLYSWERETLEEIAHQRIMDTFKELSFSVKKELLEIKYKPHTWNYLI